MDPELKRFLERFVPPIESETLGAFHRLDVKAGRFPVDAFASSLPRSVCQGDILGAFQFTWQESDGERSSEQLPGLLISHSCDYDQDDSALLAPCYPADRFRRASFYGALVLNKKNSLFYLPGIPNRSPMVADLSLIQPFSTEFIRRGVADRSIERICSFSDVGYVYFVLKLAHHLMRPQPADESREGAKAWALSQRLGFTLQHALGLVKFALHG